MTNIPASLQAIIDQVKTAFPGEEKLHEMFAQCFVNTYSTTLKHLDDGTTFVITGDYSCHVATRFCSPSSSLFNGS